MKTYHCCWVDQDTLEPCRQPAEWSIWALSGEPYDYIHACTDHVGALLTDAREHHIFHLEDGD